MATLADALQTKAIELYRLPDHEGRDPIRPLYVASTLFDWIDETAELYEEDWAKQTGGRTRFEHLEQAFADFRCDKRPLVGDLTRVQPTKKGVWKIHSSGLRTYGWVPEPNSFVAVKIAFSDDIHGPENLTDQMVFEVIEFAKTRGLHHTFKMGDKSALFQIPA
jgi:hypothetical protein